MINVLIEEYIGCTGILEEQWADLVSRSQGGITEEVMFQELLGEHVGVQQVEKNV